VGQPFRPGPQQQGGAVAKVRGGTNVGRLAAPLGLALCFGIDNTDGAPVAGAYAEIQALTINGTRWLY
jgi:hypothetical protein